MRLIGTGAGMRTTMIEEEKKSNIMQPFFLFRFIHEKEKYNDISELIEILDR